MKSEEYEKAILGIILKSSNPQYSGLISIDEIFEQVLPKMFNQPENEIIYRAMIKLREKKQPVDIVTLPEEVRGKVNMESLFSLFEETSVTVNYKFYVGKLIDCWSRRQLSYVYEKASKDIRNMLLESGEIIRGVQKAEENSIRTNFDEIIPLDEDIKREMEKPENYKLFETEINSLDHTIDFCRGDLVLVNGEPGMGKTSLTLNFLIKAQENGLKCLYVSLDTAKNVMFNRLVAIKKNQPLGDIKYNRASWQQLKKEDIDNIYFGYHTCQTVEAIHRAILRYHFDVVFIDHNLKLETEQRTQNLLQKYDYLAGYLSSLALKTDTCIFLVCHTNRNETKELSLNNIYGSGGWGREAVTVLHLEGKKLENVEYQYMKLRVLKSRNQAARSIYVKYLQEYVTFYDSNRLEFDEVNGNPNRSIKFPSKNKFNRDRDGI